MNIVIAPDSYKGSLTAVEVGTIIQKAFLSEFPHANIEVVPMADGGEGTLDAFMYAIGGERFSVEVTGPLGSKIATKYGVLEDGKTVVIEMAKIAGLPMVPPEKRDPYKTTSYGIGEIIIHAMEKGYRQFIIGLGGSATNDGGLGMLQALGVTFIDGNGETVKPFGEFVKKVAKVDFSSLHPLVKECQFQIASDVDNPLCGERGASHVFGPQKGATPHQVFELDKALDHYANVIEKEIGKSYKNVKGAGAAGGLGYAFLLLGGKMMSGSRIVAEVTQLEEKIKQADWVITGEGQSDFQTLYGKVPSYVAAISRQYGAKPILISGSLGTGYEQLYEQFVSCYSIASGPMSLEQCIKQAKELLFTQAKNVARLIRAASV
ncbi:glycerate kinase [Anoxybacillus vitaminiphilus]|uniref:Glycerate kinase n=1 Tax=Paranoxybacillus vitaminiphilus TaxID=581036 RepID=A0A327YA03_9BACL|nr:glycerate kinase [Anoxybacillus vitaminiphilus]RAK16615.1 glycerate kinase [Anoxybacillus vitaminiphilus]